MQQGVGTGQQNVLFNDGCFVGFLPGYLFEQGRSFGLVEQGPRPKFDYNRGRHGTKAVVLGRIFVVITFVVTRIRMVSIRGRVDNAVIIQLYDFAGQRRVAPAFVQQHCKTQKQRSCKNPSIAQITIYIVPSSGLSISR